MNANRVMYKKPSAPSHVVVGGRDGQQQLQGAAPSVAERRMRRLFKGRLFEGKISKC
jgi:hypothetical protein